ncbi:MAG: hypothetical protein E2P02_21355 [Acidobacteria bacterium]|nr:MAG: hypothetical protein E2P02_21355 [Acidobacteriota bacterium]
MSMHQTDLVVGAGRFETQPQVTQSEDSALHGSIPRAVLAGTSGPALTILRGKELTPYVLSRDELITRSARLARHFRDLGMQPEQRVLLLLPTDLAFLTSLMALWFNSAVSVPVVHHSSKKNHAMWCQKVRRILETSQPRFVIGTEHALAAIGTLVDGERHPVLISENEVLRIMEEPGEPALPELPDEGALAHCQFTSGSTGEPKGILVRHGQIVANLDAAAERIDLREGDRFLSWLPLHHDMGFIGGLLFPLYEQIPQVLLPTDSFARAPHLWLELISHYRVSLSPAPTFAYELLATRVSDSRLRGIDLSSWRYAWVGAEPIFQKTLFGFRSRFRRDGLPEHALAPCYGLAEATLAVSATEPGREVSVAWVKRDPLQAEGVVEPGREDDDESISIVGVGRPLSWAQTRLVDDADVLVGEGHEGRILVRGKCVCRENLTRERLVETGPWLDTGDLGFGPR